MCVCAHLWERKCAAGAVRWPKPVGSARHWGWRTCWHRYSFLVPVSLVAAAGLHGETPEHERVHAWVKWVLHHLHIHAHVWLEAASLRFTQGRRQPSLDTLARHLRLVNNATLLWKTTQYSFFKIDYNVLGDFYCFYQNKEGKLKTSVSCYSTLKSYMQSKRWKVIVPDLQMPRGVASLLWQSTESFNSRQRAHDGSGPMGFKRINIQVTASRGASWGQHCIVE